MLDVLGLAICDHNGDPFVCGAVECRGGDDRRTGGIWDCVCDPRDVIDVDNDSELGVSPRDLRVGTSWGDERSDDCGSGSG